MLNRRHFPGTRPLRYLLLLIGLSLSGTGHALVIKIATVSPDGSVWMNSMRSGAKIINTETQGRIKLKFYPGGVMGSDKSVLRKIRIGQLQGGAVTASNLTEYYPDIVAYTLPLLFESYAAVDYVRARMDKGLLEKLEKKGFVSFGIVEFGFAYLMSTAPIRKLSDMRSQRVWSPEGEQISYAIFKAAQVSPVPLPLSDVMTGLQTGLINTVAASPIAAIALQWHTKLKYFTDAPIGYFYGVLAIDRKVFQRIKPGDQAIMRSVLGKISAQLSRRTRIDNQQAREALANQGIRFLTPDATALAEWRAVAKEATAKLIANGVVDQKIFDTMRSHLHDFQDQTTAR